MASSEEVQALLRFLSKDAKLPLAAAMGNIAALRKAELGTPQKIAAANLEQLKTIFADEKAAKAVLNAAKRTTKKRGAAAAGADEPASLLASSKKRKTLHDENAPEDLEASLALPAPVTDEDRLSKAVIHTNRAPLVLAFAVVLLKYSMPQQPLSSRLSLAQAVVSANSRSKAVSIGLESGRSAEEEGWGEGQPVVKVMGREIRVMKRWGYEWKRDAEGDEREGSGGTGTQQSSTTLKADDDGLVDVGETTAIDPSQEKVEVPALWGIDLEALKKSSSVHQPHSKPTIGASLTNNLPIHTPQSARAYLFRAFDSPPDATSDTPSSPSKKKTVSASHKQLEKEHNLGMLLGALDLLYKSWAGTLDAADLDRRAWNWYVRVRPEVKDGVAGWGGKGDVKLADILALRR